MIPVRCVSGISLLHYQGRNGAAFNGVEIVAAAAFNEVEIVAAVAGCRIRRFEYLGQNCGLFSWALEYRYDHMRGRITGS